MRHSAARTEHSTELRSLVPARLREFLVQQRWFGGKAKQIASLQIAEVIPLRQEGREFLLLIVRVSYAAAEEELYVIPVSYSRGAPDQVSGTLLVRYVDSDERVVEIRDASTSDDFLLFLLEAITGRASFHGDSGGKLTGFSSAEPLPPSGTSGGLQPRLLTGEQSNTSVIYGQRWILKLFRRLEEGINPELEVGTFLTEKAHFAHIPKLAGYLEYRAAEGEPMTQAILQEFVPNQGDAWRYTIKAVTAFYEEIAKRGAAIQTPLPDPSNLDHYLPDGAARVLGGSLNSAGLLGRRTAELHLALASDQSDPAFAPEPFTMQFQGGLQASIEHLANATLVLLHENLPKLPTRWRNQALEVADQREAIIERCRRILSKPIQALRARIHGDYHLGQVLYTGSDFVIIDFEGEPARPLSERRSKRSPLQDVAGMLRSFHYAAFAPLIGAQKERGVSHDEQETLTPWAEEWNARVGGEFLKAYRGASSGAAYLPADGDHFNKLLELHLLEKAVYELNYELNNRPAWVGIPLQGITQILSVNNV